MLVSPRLVAKSCMMAIEIRHIKNTSLPRSPCNALAPSHTQEYHLEDGNCSMNDGRLLRIGSLEAKNLRSGPIRAPPLHRPHHLGLQGRHSTVGFSSMQLQGPVRASERDGQDSTTLITSGEFTTSGSCGLP